jgi:hypothetical protein
MAFYFVNDGVVDTAVSFQEDESQISWLWWLQAAAAGIATDSSTGSGPNISAGVASVDAFGSTDREGGALEAQYVARLATWDIETPWYALEAAATSSNLVASQTLDGISQTATFAAIESLSASQTIGDFSQSATFTAIDALSAAQTIGDITQTATFTSSTSNNLVAAQTIDAISQSASFTNVASIISNQTLGQITQTATFASVASLNAAQTIGDISQVATFTGTAATLSLSANQTLGDVTQSATFTVGSTVSQSGGAFGPSSKRYYRRYDVYNVEADLVKVAESAQRSTSRKARKQQLAKVQRSLSDFLSRVEPQSDLPLSVSDLRAAYDLSIAQASQDFAYAQWKDNVLRSVNQALIELRLQIEIIEEEDNDMLLMVL